jgi:hypothetical protein
MERTAMNNIPTMPCYPAWPSPTQCYPTYAREYFEFLCAREMQMKNTTYAADEQTHRILTSLLEIRKTHRK